MGTSLHLHVEVRVDGKWLHWNQPYIHHDYALDAKLGLENTDEDIAYFAPCRGLPPSVSPTTKLDADRWEEDAHSHSWLSGEEAEQVQEWYYKLRICTDRHPPLFGYVFGADIGGYEDIQETLEDSGHTFGGVRIVYWFDN